MLEPFRRGMPGRFCRLRRRPQGTKKEVAYPSWYPLVPSLLSWAKCLIVDCQSFNRRSPSISRLAKTLVCGLDTAGRHSRKRKHLGQKSAHLPNHLPTYRFHRLSTSPRPVSSADEAQFYTKQVMANNRKRHRPKLLSHTRPKFVKKPTTLPSKATRSLIRNHHAIHKQLFSATAHNDVATAASLQAQLSASGGLGKYQEASIQGQSLERGGDSSKVLMQWLAELLPDGDAIKGASASRLRMLEVGALRTDNACSRSGLFDVTRIDLHSQHPDIETQDFMERPVPNAEEMSRKGFDIVSLSLVVNYVSDGVGRGEMLKRVSSFLRSTPAGIGSEDEMATPSLFLVLPAPCVSNSRYLNEERLEAMMLGFGYMRVRRKMSAKLVYYLWRYDGASKSKGNVFKKVEVRKGGSRNNFAIVIT